MLGIETKKVAKMNEEAAVALGADILGEGTYERNLPTKLNCWSDSIRCDPKCGHCWFGAGIRSTSEERYG